jgi:hypothetical protein
MRNITKIQSIIKKLLEQLNDKLNDVEEIGKPWGHTTY